MKTLSVILAGLCPLIFASCNEDVSPLYETRFEQYGESFTFVIPHNIADPDFVMDFVTTSGKEFKENLQNLPKQEDWRLPKGVRPGDSVLVTIYTIVKESESKHYEENFSRSKGILPIGSRGLMALYMDPEAKEKLPITHGLKYVFAFDATENILRFQNTDSIRVFQIGKLTASVSSVAYGYYDKPWAKGNYIVCFRKIEEPVYQEIETDTL